MADHSLARGPNHSRKMQDRRLIQLEGVVLPQCEVFLVAWHNIEILWCLLEMAGGRNGQEVGNPGRRGVEL
jgi:hypothetical protein